MRKVIGIGETRVELAFQTPNFFTASVGGDILSFLLPLPPKGISPIYISEISRDAMGDLALSFLQEAGIHTDNIYRFYEGQTTLNISFDDIREDVSYENMPDDRCEFVWPRVDQGDIFLFSASYSFTTAIRPHLLEMIEYVRTRKGLVIYDTSRIEKLVNVLQVMPLMMDNYELSHLMFTSSDSLQKLYQERDSFLAYKNHIRFYGPVCICFEQDGQISIMTPRVAKRYSIPTNLSSEIDQESSMKSFLIYSISQSELQAEDLLQLDESGWDALMQCSEV